MEHSGPDGRTGSRGAYLDHAATTPMRAEAVAAMLPYCTAEFANPSGVHAAARRARRALDDARDEMASVLGCAPGEVVFTSGGTEADNLAVLGVHGRVGGLVVTSAIEHDAVLNPARRVGARIVGVTAQGVVDLDALALALDETATLVSVMAGVESTIIAGKGGRKSAFHRECCISGRAALPSTTAKVVSRTSETASRSPIGSLSS